MLLTPSDPDIQTIVARIKSGDIDLQPEFQRGEVWSTGKKRRLIDSILRDWHIPPIHTVVVPESGKQEVLDGQQRLAAIRDFVDNIFPIDGNIPPHDGSIRHLHNLKYRDLPDNVRRRFDSFTIRVIKITNHKPEEPGELFFRLNQITNVTAAEQRNAFYGPVRQQVKALVATFEQHGNSQDTLGFSNSRMAYDDVLSKFLCTIECGTLNEKLTASVISDRFRSNIKFASEVYSLAEDVLHTFSLIRQGVDTDVRFNKATLLSWLIFITSFTKYKRDDLIANDKFNFMSLFERIRSAPIHELVRDGTRLTTDMETQSLLELFVVFNDRSTSRVLDVSSVTLRDLILHIMFWSTNGKGLPDLPVSSAKMTCFENVINILGTIPSHQVAEILEETVDFAAWGKL